MNPRLDLFGVIHFDRLSKVEAELTEYVEETDADAIFIEQPSEELTRRMIVHAVLRAPATFLGVLLAGLFQGVLFALFNRRLATTEHIVAGRLSGRYPVHEVDRNLPSLLADSGAIATLANWVVIIGFLVWMPVQTGLTGIAVLFGGAVVNLTALRSRRFAAFSVVVVAVGFVVLAVVTDVLAGWFLFTLVFAFAVSVKRVHDTRNQYMLERVTIIADEKGYDSSVLVTGKAHLSGFTALANDSGFTLVRTYTPRWLRAPGKIDENPSTESTEEADETTDKRPIEPGSVGMRAAASFIDLVVLVVLLWIPGLGLAAVTEAVFGGALSGFVIGVAITPFVYHVVLEAAFGCTVGKRLTKLVVTDTDGSSPSVRACLLRNLLRPVDFVVFYLVGALVMALTRRHQRLGDLIAGTEVRKID